MALFFTPWNHSGNYSDQAKLWLQRNLTIISIVTVITLLSTLLINVSVHHIGLFKRAISTVRTLYSNAII